MPLGPGQNVRHIDNPAKLGTVTNQSPRARASGQQYPVQWQDGVGWHYEAELEVVVPDAVEDVHTLIKEGRYARSADLQRILTQIRLSGRLANVVYSMGLTETDFYPHQYKPLLTLLDSPANGLLIADEVGLGKTIEAGLIWTELRARFDMRRLLVVCPAALREKWQDELSRRFGLDPRIVGAKELLEELRKKTNTRQERAWIVSYPGARVPRRWSPDEEANEDNEDRKRPAHELADLLQEHAGRAEALLDLVIFDEAHTMRNEDTGAFRLGDLLRQVSEHQVMLSATPINLHAGDLFNLLHLLDPDHFASRDDFTRLREANQPIIRVSQTVRDAASTPQEILEAVNDLQASDLLPQLRVARLIQDARGISDWDRKHRVEFAARTERLNLLAHVVVRTRKREVQLNRVVRDVSLVEVPMTPHEQLLYKTVTEGTRDYAEARGITSGFLVCMPQRMVSSCGAALLKAWNAETLAEAEADPDVLATVADESGEDETELQAADARLREFLAARVRKVFRGIASDEFARHDSKFDELAKKLREALDQDPAEKAIVFTTFRGTARYLVERFSLLGIGATLLMGGPQFDKESVVARFRADRENRVLVCTEVMAEGVDLQFCRLLINYDLPWNPTRLEQRVGRIDRIGQKAERILIWNFVHADTIDARIVERLNERIDVFQNTLGATEEVLGQVRNLESVLLTRHLTPEEEKSRIDEAALALENIRKSQEALERDAVHLVAHGQELLDRIELARGEGRSIGRKDLIRHVESWLRNLPGCRFLETREDPDSFEIQLSPAEADALEQFLLRENIKGVTALISGRMQLCRFADRITERPKAGEEIVHRFHPLVRFITQRSELASRFPLYAAQVPADGIQHGIYALTAWRTKFGGVKDEDDLLIAAVSIDGTRALPEQEAQRLFDLARNSATDWENAKLDVDATQAIAQVELCEESLREQYDAIKRDKQAENAERAEVQLTLLEDHIRNRRLRSAEIIQRHEAVAALEGSETSAKRRLGLANAERKKLENLLAKMQVRREKIMRARDSFTADKEELCVTLMKVLPRGPHNG